MSYKAQIGGCPQCGGSLHHTNATPVHAGRTNAGPHQWVRAILRCADGCHRNWELSVTLAPGPSEPQRIG